MPGTSSNSGQPTKEANQAANGAKETNRAANGTGASQGGSVRTSGGQTVTKVDFLTQRPQNERGPMGFEEKRK
jgi:hypothetical protein